jgi:hypothetical protein
MSDSIMPNLRTGTRRRTLWIDNLKADRHTDALIWTEGEAAGDSILVLDEAQTRDLLTKLTAQVNSRDRKD